VGRQRQHWEFKGNEFSARNWHQWAKPGAVIVVDEFQKMWPPRANGAKVPPDVQALDTHRHMGVDFVLITQSVMNTDRHIHALGGRHLHVRRVANMKMAVVYEWDHVSRSLQYSKAISKGAWRYSRKVFKLYRSAEVHTKQPRKLPGLVWFILAGLGAGVFLMPTVYDRFGQRFNPTAKQEPAKPGTSGTVPAGTQSKPAPGQQPSAPAPQAAPEPTFIDDRIAFIPRLSGKPETAPAYDAIRKVNNMPLVTGGACFKGQCKCYTQQGTDAGLTHGECRDWMTVRSVHDRPGRTGARATACTFGPPICRRAASGRCAHAKRRHHAQGGCSGVWGTAPWWTVLARRAPRHALSVPSAPWRPFWLPWYTPRPLAASAPHPAPFADHWHLWQSCARLALEKPASRAALRTHVLSLHFV